MKRVWNIFIGQEKKLRKASIPWIMLLAGTAEQDSCAKFAGIHQTSLEKIVERLVKTESVTGNYNVENSNPDA